MRRWLAVACLLPVVGCVPDLDDTCASDDECARSQVCRSSYCVPPGAGDDAAITPDSGADGAPRPDAAGDPAAPVDRGVRPDGAADATPPADAGLPDAAPDAAAPDGAAPDAAPDGGSPPDADVDPDAAIDAALPDAALPDAALPDAALPDAEATPDAALPDAALPDAEATPDAGLDAAPPEDAGPPDAGPQCGNGVVDEGEECDAPGNVLLTRCNAQCKVTPTVVSGEATIDREIQAGSFALFQVSAERTATLGISTAVEGGCPPTVELIVEDADGAPVADAQGGPNDECPTVSFAATWMPYRVVVRDTAGAAVAVETTFTVSDSCGNGQVEGDEQCDGGAQCAACLVTACGPWNPSEPIVTGSNCQPPPIDLDCPPGAFDLAAGGCTAPAPCPPGWQRIPDATDCAPMAAPACPAGQVALPNRTCSAAWACVGTGERAWDTPEGERFGCFPPVDACAPGTVPDDGVCTPTVLTDDCLDAPPPLESWLVVDPVAGHDEATGGPGDPLRTLDEAVDRVRATMAVPPLPSVYAGIYLVAGEHAASVALPDIRVEGAGADATTLVGLVGVGEAAGPLSSATLRCLALQSDGPTVLEVRGAGEVVVDRATLRAGGPVIDMRGESTLNLTRARIEATEADGIRMARGAVSLMQFVEVVAPGAGLRVVDEGTEALLADAALRGPGPAAVADDAAYVELLGVLVSGAGDGGAALQAAAGGELNLDRLVVRDTVPGAHAVSISAASVLTVGDVFLRDNPGGHVVVAGRVQPLVQGERATGHLTIRGAGLPLQVDGADAEFTLDRVSIGGAGPTPAVRVVAGSATLDWLDVADRASPAAQDQPVLEVGLGGALIVRGGLVERWDARPLTNQGTTDLTATLWRAPAAPPAAARSLAGRLTLTDVRMSAGVAAEGEGIAELTRVQLDPTVGPALAALDGGSVEVTGVRTVHAPQGARVASALRRATLSGVGLFVIGDDRGPGIEVVGAATLDVTDLTLRDSASVGLLVTGDGALAQLHRAFLEGASALPGAGPGRLIAVEGGGRVVLEQAVVRSAAEHGLQATGGEAELTDVRVEDCVHSGLVTAADARLTAIDLLVARNGASGILSRFGAMSLTRVAFFDNDVGLRFGRGAEPQHTLRFFLDNRVPWIACGLLCPLAGPALSP